MKKQSKKQGKKQPVQQKDPLLLALAGGIGLVALALVVVLLLPGNLNKGEFVPPAFDENAVSGTPDPVDWMCYSELYQEGMAYRVNICGIPCIDGKELAVYFANVEENEAYLKLRVLDTSGDILGETGLLRPGEYIRAVTLSKAIQPGTDVKLKIMSYDPETYESLGSVGLNVTVQEE